VKILLIAPHPFFQARGTPIAVRRVLEFLSARGHQVDLLTFHEGADVEIPSCRIFRIVRVPGIRNIRPGFSLKKIVCDTFMFAKCLGMVLRTRYDLIHAVEEGAFIAAVMQAVTGVPYVYDMDSSLAEQLVEAYPELHVVFPILRRLEAIAVRRSLGVLTVCAALEDVALAYAPEKPVGRVEDATLLTGAAPFTHNGYARLPHGANDGGPVVMYVGNLERYQGIGLLLEGFRHTLDRVPTARLVIVGGRDDDVHRYQSHAASLGILAAVEFTGPRPLSLLGDLFRQADVLVSPRLKGLNTPMKIYSYLDSGIAVLATRVRTHTQVLNDENAYLVEPEPRALGGGLADLLNDAALRERLARKAKAFVQREFTPEAAWRKLDTFYRQMESRAVEARA
jgi:glycosyltransferase involved in cell wall biosynthesis